MLEVERVADRRYQVRHNECGEQASQSKGRRNTDRSKDAGETEGTCWRQATRRDRPEHLHRMLPVRFAIEHVVEKIGGAGNCAEDQKRCGRALQRSLLENRVREYRRSEHEQVLQPLLWPNRRDQRDR